MTEPRSEEPRHIAVSCCRTVVEALRSRGPPNASNARETPGSPGSISCIVEGSLRSLLNGAHRTRFQGRRLPPSRWATAQHCSPEPRSPPNVGY